MSSKSEESIKQRKSIIQKIEEQHQFSIWRELKNRATVVNLAISVACFSMASFNFYMISFYMKYVGGNIYVNVMLSTLSENVGNFAAFLLQKKFGTRRSFMAAFFGAMMFSVPLIFVEQEVLIALCVFLTRFCVEASFMLAFFVNSEIFPPLFVPFAFSL